MEKTTLYKSYKKSGIILNRKQYLAVGIKVKQLYEQIFGELPPKTEQKEPESLNYAGKNPRLITYQVYTYPMDFHQLIVNLLEEEAKNPKRSTKTPVEI